MRRTPSLAILALLASSACMTNVGPGTVPTARSSYNARLSQSTLEQTLLNVVRLRYRDQPYFLEVGAVLTQYEVQGSARIGDVGWGGSIDQAVALGGVSAQVAERPTITYQPLLGEAFVRRLLAPIPIGAYNLLAGTGWSIERLMLCCMDEVNGVQNASAAAGPGPKVLHDDPRFRESARVMRQLQLAGIVEFVRPTDSTPTGRIHLERARISTPEDAEAFERLVQRLNLRRDQDDFLIGPPSDTGAKVLHVYPRSPLATMFYLSNGIDIPEEHVRKGFVTVTRAPDGTPIDWQEVMGGIFRVRSGKDQPDDAYVAVRHRGYWYWIADDDLETKTTMGLLGFMMALQSVGSPQGAAPLLTLPTAR